MIRNAILSISLLVICVYMAACTSNEQETTVSGTSGAALPAPSKNPQEIAPGVTVALAWLDFGQSETYVVATLHNQSKSVYRLDLKGAFFTARNERIDASDILPHDGLSPGFEGKVAWQFSRKKDEFADATLTINGASWKGDFTKLVKPISSPPPSK